MDDRTGRLDVPDTAADPSRCRRPGAADPGRDRAHAGGLVGDRGRDSREAASRKPHGQCSIRRRRQNKGLGLDDDGNGEEHGIHDDRKGEGHGVQRCRVDGRMVGRQSRERVHRQDSQQSAARPAGGCRPDVACVQRWRIGSASWVPTRTAVDRRLATCTPIACPSIGGPVRCRRTRHAAPWPRRARPSVRAETNSSRWFETIRSRSALRPC